VTSTPTSDGGTLLAATFDNRLIPPSLKAAGRTLFGLSAITCLRRGDGRLDCGPYEVLDHASSVLHYRV
jgi:hypothetical protein